MRSAYSRAPAVHDRESFTRDTQVYLFEGVVGGALNIKYTLEGDSVNTKMSKNIPSGEEKCRSGI